MKVVPRSAFLVVHVSKKLPNGKRGTWSRLALLQMFLVTPIGLLFVPPGTLLIPSRLLFGFVRAYVGPAGFSFMFLFDLFDHVGPQGFQQGEQPLCICLTLT